MSRESSGCLAWAVIAAFVVVLVGLGMWLMPMYNVWQRELAGKAQLREAEWNRQIRVEEAKAEQEAAVAFAAAEVARARGVAEANQIIGDSLEGNDEYLRYLWIQALMDDSNSIIYVPTEANIPIMEAGRTPSVP